jgi:copper chaperone CopZ
MGTPAASLSNERPFRVPAIHCGACAVRIRRALEGVEGVEVSAVDLSEKRVTLRFASIEALAFGLHRLAEAGYPAEPVLVPPC